MTMPVLRQSDILMKGEEYHFSRSELSAARPKALHTQDYYELFWIHNGRARLLSASGQTRLSEGDLVILPPDLAHGLQGIGTECHIVNIILRRRRVKDLLARFSETAELFPQPGCPPVQLHRDIRHLARLSSSAKTLEAAPRSTLSLEAFLLPLLAEILQERHSAAQTVPPWLSEALVAAEHPDVFRDGAAGLVAQCGKAHAHVARTMQACLHVTPSDYINRLRMDYAARQLKGTPDTLVEIAEEIGIQNMSHFHRLFRDRFAMTPRQYRVKHQKGVVQPV